MCIAVLAAHLRHISVYFAAGNAVVNQCSKSHELSWTGAGVPCLTGFGKSLLHLAP